MDQKFMQRSNLVEMLSCCTVLMQKVKGQDRIKLRCEIQPNRRTGVCTVFSLGENVVVRCLG